MKAVQAIESSQVHNTSGLVSLEDILKSEGGSNDAEQEPKHYLMVSNALSDEYSDEKSNVRQITVTRMKIFFEGKESELLTFIDMTVHKRLQTQEIKNELLITLNASMHHEIVTPIKVNIEMAERLMELRDLSRLREMAKIVCISSKLQLFYANDLLDYRVF